MRNLHWLALPPTKWDQSDSYFYMRTFIKDMQLYVVNDTTDHAVKAKGDFYT